MLPRLQLTSIVCSLFLFLTWLVPATAQAKLNARSAILLNATTGRILYEQNANALVAPASLAKLMTLYISMANINKGAIKPSSRVKISNYAATTGGSSMGLKRNARVRFDDLLEGMVVASGNDAAAAVAEYSGKGVSSFVRKMNTQAKKLGMKNTRFKNPHGLPASGQLTTAHDMLKLARNYIKMYPRMLKVHNISAIRHNSKVLYNTNGLVSTVRGADGLKTGFISESGYNIILTAKRGDTRLIAVVLGARSRQIRDIEARRLIETGFSTPKSAKTVAQRLR